MGFSTFTCNMTSNMIPQTYNSTYINIVQWKCPKPFIQWLYNPTTVAVKKINSNGFKVDRNIHCGQQKQCLLLLTTVNIFVANIP